METSRYIQEDNTSFKISQLFLVLGLGGIGISLLYNSIPVFILITLIPLFCVGGILLLRYPWLILFVIFTTNYFILGITRYIPIEGISVIMEILYMIALVLIFIQAALFQNIEWRRAFNILSIALCIWMGYCILEIINPTSSLEGWILSRGLIFNGLIIVIITSLLCTRYSILKAIIFCLSIFTLFAVIKTLMQKFIGFDSFETKWLNAGGATTHIIWSGIRYFSFFTDASNMGANMGAAIMFFGIASLYMRSALCKIYYSCIAILALYALFLSGTRGAMIVPLAGLALYTLISKQTKMVIGGASMLLFIYIFFAFTTIGQSNSSIRRIRTAFNPTKDASYIVRKENQKKLATYLKYKPFGEGLGLSGDGLGVKISTRFTTSIPTDSWYVKIWVETGIVGLILYLSMIFLTIGWGGWIIATQIKDLELKGLLSGLLCGIFGMFINAYANSFWGQFPTMIIAFMGLTFVLNGPYFDKEIRIKKINCFK